MKSRLAILASAILVLSLLVAGPGSAAPTAGTITSSGTSDYCFASNDGTCSGGATADPTGAFSATAELDSPDSPFSRATRYSQALARYTIGFDLAEPTDEAVINVTLQLDEASASWSQDLPELFGGAQSPNSGAKVLFQLLGDEAPAGCGCGWPSQGSSNVVVTRVAAVGDATSISDSTVQLTMTARNPYGDGLLPAGHYEILMRGYALTELAGAGDWGTLTAAVTGRIQDISVSIPDSGSVLALSVTGTGSNRVLTAVLTDSGSTPLDGKTISFFGEGEFLGTATTADGIATLPVDGRFRGASRLFTAEFAGDETYGGSTAEARS